MAALATDFAPGSTHEASSGPNVVALLSRLPWHLVEFFTISLKIPVRAFPMASMHLIFALSPPWLALPMTAAELPPTESSMTGSTAVSGFIPS